MTKLINKLSGLVGIHRLCLTIYNVCAMSSASGESGDEVICRRLLKVPGDGEKWNDVIHCTDRDPRSVKQHVIFFGGDVQDYPEIMERHPVNKRYGKWNLEETGRILLKRFPGSAIFVIKATKMHLNTFSVYSNFVESNNFGCPTHESGYGSWRQLNTLYNNILQTTASDSASADSTCSVTSCPTSRDFPLIIMGFSKGCIVLNQLLYDSKETEDDPELSAFVKKIKEFYWLDGGHSGGRDTWVKDEDVVRFLATVPVKVLVHVSPYQVKDPMRAWIGKEQRRFVKLLKQFGVDVRDKLHFDDESGSIENHFRVLTVF